MNPHTSNNNENTNSRSPNKFGPNTGIRFTPEDRSILNSLYKDAAIKRGYPLAAAFGGATYFGLSMRFPKMGNVAKFLWVLGAGGFGSMVGRFSYMSAALKRIEPELPADSGLRKMLEMRRRDHQQTFDRPDLRPPAGEPTVPEAPRNDDNFTTDNSETLAPPPGRSQTEATPSTTYADLRRQHREKEKNIDSGRFSSAVSPSSDYGESFSDIPSNSKSKVRYNKYGDPILD